MLLETDMFGMVYDKVKDSIQLLKDFEPEDGYYLAFSGGKDSICIKRLADMAAVKYDAHYNVTTIDPPELVRFIRNEHPDVKFDHPEKPFLRKMETKGFPQRQRRWCCELYKEAGGSGRKVVTGVRKAESAKRAGRRPVEICYKDKSKTYVNPIINWSDNEVWEFIKVENLPYCSLYDEEWNRIGCLFCPMAGKHRLASAKRYPRMVKAFIRAFETLHATGRDSMKRWQNGEEMFWWWMKEDRKSEDPDQTVLFE